MHLRSSLSKVHGLGPAKSGTLHWWSQRISAVALIPLSYWFIIFLELSLYAPFQDTIIWLKAPLNSAALIAWIIAAFYHAALGLQVVAEDYLHSEGQKIVVIWSIKLLFMFLVLFALLAVFRITLTG